MSKPSDHAPEVAANPQITGDERIDELLERVRRTSISKSVSASEWDEITTFLEENPPMTEEKSMKEYNSGKDVGVAQERNRIVKMLQEIASSYFIGRQDELASRFRDLAARVQKGE